MVAGVHVWLKVTFRERAEVALAGGFLKSSERFLNVKEWKSRLVLVGLRRLRGELTAAHVKDGSSLFSRTCHNRTRSDRSKLKEGEV